MDSKSILSLLQVGGGLIQGLSLTLNNLGKTVELIANDYIKRDQDTKQNLSSWTPEIEEKLKLMNDSIKSNYIGANPILTRLINESNYKKYVKTAANRDDFKMVYSSRPEGLSVECFHLTNDYSKDTCSMILILQDGSIAVSREA